MIDWELIEGALSIAAIDEAIVAFELLRQQMEQQEGDIARLKGLIAEAAKVALDCHTTAYSELQGAYDEDEAAKMIYDALGPLHERLASVGTQGEQPECPNCANPPHEGPCHRKYKSASASAEAPQKKQTDAERGEGSCPLPGHDVTVVQEEGKTKFVRDIPAGTQGEQLDLLIEKARHHVMTPEEEEAQVRSFAYGNVKLHNPAITREDVDRGADKIMLARQQERIERLQEEIQRLRNMVSALAARCDADEDEIGGEEEPLSAQPEEKP